MSHRFLVTFSATFFSRFLHVSHDTPDQGKIRWKKVLVQKNWYQIRIPHPFLSSNIPRKYGLRLPVQKLQPLLWLEFSRFLAKMAKNGFRGRNSQFLLEWTTNNISRSISMREIEWCYSRCSKPNRSWDMGVHSYPEPFLALCQF